MFDIGFWELTLIGVVALLVVGPERLPALARTVGLYAGKMRRWVAQVRGEVERELRAEEIRQAVRNAEGSETVRGVSDAMRMDDVKEAFKTAGTAIKDVADAAKKPAVPSIAPDAGAAQRSDAAVDTEATTVAKDNASKPVATGDKVPTSEPIAGADAAAADGEGGRERGAG